MFIARNQKKGTAHRTKIVNVLQYTRFVRRKFQCCVRKLNNMIICIITVTGSVNSKYLHC